MMRKTTSRAPRNVTRKLTSASRARCSVSTALSCGLISLRHRALPERCSGRESAKEPRRYFFSPARLFPATSVSSSSVRVFFSPAHQADVDGLDGPVFPDDDRQRDGRGAVLGADGAVFVEGHGDVQLLRGQELLDGRGVLVLVDGVQDNAFVLVSRGDFLDDRHGLPARPAPRGPEVQDDDLFALVLRKRHLAAAEQGQFEVRRRLAGRNRGGFIRLGEAGHFLRALGRNELEAFVRQVRVHRPLLEADRQLHLRIGRHALPCA